MASNRCTYTFTFDVGSVPLSDLHIEGIYSFSCSDITPPSDIPLTNWNDVLAELIPIAQASVGYSTYPSATSNYTVQKVGTNVIITITNVYDTCGELSMQIMDTLDNGYNTAGVKTNCKNYDQTAIICDYEVTIPAIVGVDKQITILTIGIYGELLGLSWDSSTESTTILENRIKDLLDTLSITYDSVTVIEDVGVSFTISIIGCPATIDFIYSNSDGDLYYDFEESNCREPQPEPSDVECGCDCDESTNDIISLIAGLYGTLSIFKNGANEYSLGVKMALNYEYSEDSVIDCESKERDFVSIIKSLIDKQSKRIISVIVPHETVTPYFTCDNKDESLMTAFLKSLTPVNESCFGVRLIQGSNDRTHLTCEEVQLLSTEQILKKSFVVTQDGKVGIRVIFDGGGYNLECDDKNILQVDALVKQLFKYKDSNNSEILSLLIF